MRFGEDVHTLSGNGHGYRLEADRLFAVVWQALERLANSRVFQ
jgi:hypothetical protein